jgi:hypothetical protein
VSLIRISRFDLRRAAVLCVVLAGPPGCAPEDQRSAAGGRIGTLRESGRIGTLDGPVEYTFGAISAFTVGPGGEVYIAEARGEIRHYNRDGEFVRRIARQGAGPGEVRSVIAMAVSPADVLAVVDQGNQRVSVWSAEGEYLRQVRLPGGRQRYGRDGITFDADGEIWLGIFPPRSGREAVDAGRPRPLYGRLAGDGEVRDTVFLPDRDWSACLTRDPAFEGGWYEDVRESVAPVTQWYRSADGTLAVGCSASYRIHVIRGDIELDITRDWEPIAISPEERASWARPQSVGYAPEHKPVFTRLWIADDGRIWVRRTQQSQRQATSDALRSRGAPQFTWVYHLPTDGLDVFDADGSWRGHVATPTGWASEPFPGLGDPYMRGDTVWAATRGALREMYLSKFVVEWTDAPRD